MEAIIDQEGFSFFELKINQTGLAINFENLHGMVNQDASIGTLAEHAGKFRAFFFHENIR